MRKLILAFAILASLSSILIMCTYAFILPPVRQLVYTDLTVHGQIGPEFASNFFDGEEVGGMVLKCRKSNTCTAGNLEIKAQESAGGIALSISTEHYYHLFPTKNQQHSKIVMEVEKMLQSHGQIATVKQTGQ